MRGKGNPFLSLGSLSWARPSKAFISATGHTQEWGARGKKLDLPRDGLGLGWKCKRGKADPASGL